MSSDHSPIIGIDLGTTFSSCALFTQGILRVFDNALGNKLTPSVVAFDQRSKSRVTGRIAKDILTLHPNHAVARFKRDMGSDRENALADQACSAIELSAYILDGLRSDAERKLGCSVRRCVITVPAYFNETQRVATRRAGELAGLVVERILNEPTAAAIAHGLHRAEEESTFLVFDLGGGTFDVCVLERFEGMLEVKSVAGESRLGGEDFTHHLCDALLEQVDIEPKAAKAADVGAWSLLYKRAELLKRRLSSWNASTLEIPPFRGHSKASRQINFTAAQADAAYQPLIHRLLSPCRTALRGARLEPRELSEIILVGGATRMPCVQRFCTELFGRQPLADVDPDLLVTRGAAIQAALIAEDEAVEDLVVTDISSHSLGVDSSVKIATRYDHNYFVPIIHRNTTIPTSRSHSFTPLYPDQTAVDFQVYEGESRRIENNTKIGNLRLEGIPTAPADQQVVVTFTYDLSGILEVSATISATGETVSEIFHREGKTLQGEELELAQQRIRSLKAEPRDQVRNRDLIARAELLWQDLPEAEREVLDIMLQMFESALALRQTEQIEPCFTQLEEFCQRFDGGERW